MKTNSQTPVFDPRVSERDETIILSDGANPDAAPPLLIKLEQTAGSFDLQIETGQGTTVAAISVDYFAGELQTLVYLPESDEPAAIVKIKKLTGEN